MKRFVILLPIVLLLIGGGIAYWALTPKGVDKWPQASVVEAIIREKPSLYVDDKPVVAIESMSMPVDGWYVATIRSIHTSETAVPVKVLLSDTFGSDDELRVILGPDVFSSDYSVSNPNIPKKAIEELTRS